MGGVSISHPERVVYPEDGITKADIARYYASVGDEMVAHVEGRPLSLVRCPETIEERIFMRHTRAWGPTTLRRVAIPEKHKIGEYLVADTPDAVVGLAQMGIVEIHTWNSTDRDLERPSRVVMDLDPDESLPWSRVRDAALVVRSALEANGLASFVKTTGGKVEFPRFR